MECVLEMKLLIKSINQQQAREAKGTTVLFRAVGGSGCALEKRGAFPLSARLPRL